MDRQRSHPKSAPRRPEGQPTRGKTHPNRLRRVDNFLLRYAPALLRHKEGPWAHAPVVDLGYGEEPLTTLEMAHRLRRLNPALPVLGVEIDPDRVAAAQPFADDLTHFRLGGFNLPLEAGGGGHRETVRLIRAFNVLRQYDEDAVLPAWERLGSYLIPGGLLIEGTSDPFGRLWVANLLRREGSQMAPRALVFSAKLGHDFSPTDFQAVLPKNLIHRVVPGEPIHDFIDAWMRARKVTARMQSLGARQWFVAAAQELARQGWSLDTRVSWLRGGYLILFHLDPQGNSHKIER